MTATSKNIESIVKQWTTFDLKTIQVNFISSWIYVNYFQKHCFTIYLCLSFFDISK